jgi:oligoribonuclease (3'-5' exoribonuclease)
MIYSYLDTLLDKWIEWSEGFLSEKPESDISDVNSILGTKGSDNPTRANEFYKIGLLKLPLTGSDNGFELLKKNVSIHTDFGYLSFLIRKAQSLTTNNPVLEDSFKALSTISFIQQYIKHSKSEISLNFILQNILEKFPVPSKIDERIYFRYLSAGMFCELKYDSDSFINNIINKKSISLRIIEQGTKNVRITFFNNTQIVQAIHDKVALTNIIYEKGSLFLLVDQKI